MPICTGCERPYDNGTNGLHACDERDRIDVLERQVDRLSRWIVDHERYVTGARDHACAECVPGGPIVSKTFICARHLARAIHKAIADRQEHEDATASVRPAPTPCQCPEVEQGTVYFCGLHDVPNEKGEYGEGQDRACVRGEMRPRGVPGVASELHRSSGTSTEALPQRGVDDQKRVGVDLPRVRGAQDVDPRPSDARPYDPERDCPMCGRPPVPDGRFSCECWPRNQRPNDAVPDPQCEDCCILKSETVDGDPILGACVGDPIGNKHSWQRTDKPLPEVDRPWPKTRKQMTRSAYAALVAEDLAWLDKQPSTLESRHIRAIVEMSIEGFYGEPRPETAEKQPTWDDVHQAFQAGEKNGRAEEQSDIIARIQALVVAIEKGETAPTGSLDRG